MRVRAFFAPVPALSPSRPPTRVCGWPGGGEGRRREFSNRPLEPGNGRKGNSSFQSLPRIRDHQNNLDGAFSAPLSFVRTKMTCVNWPVGPTTEMVVWRAIGDSNPGPADYDTTTAFAAPELRGSWPGLSLHPGPMAVRWAPSSLYTFPAFPGLGSGSPSTAAGGVPRI